MYCTVNCWKFWCQHIITFLITRQFRSWSIVGHTVIGHTIVGHTIVGHTVVGHTVLGHTIVGHTVVGHTVVELVAICLPLWKDRINSCQYYQEISPQFNHFYSDSVVYWIKFDADKRYSNIRQQNGTAPRNTGNESHKDASLLDCFGCCSG